MIDDEYTNDVLNDVLKENGTREFFKMGSVIEPHRKYRHVSIDEMYN